MVSIFEEMCNNHIVSLWEAIAEVSIANTVKQSFQEFIQSALTAYLSHWPILSFFPFTYTPHPPPDPLNNSQA